MPPKKIAPKKRTEKRSPARIRWCFRINSAMQSLDCPEDIREMEATRLYAKLIDYCDCFAFQLEVGDTKNLVHFQGYFETIIKKRHTTIQNEMGHFNYLEPIKGSPQQAWAYATKESTRLYGPWTLGELTMEGKRTDLIDFRNAIQSGSDDTKLWELFPNCMGRYRNMPSDIRAVTKPKRENPLEVALFFGPPGTGKTDYAHECAEALGVEAYELPIGKDFWVTKSIYGKKLVIIDEFKSNVSLKDLLKLLDKRPIEAPMKGNFMWWMPDTIIITTNVSPWYWYEYNDRDFEREALFRRIGRTFKFEKNAEKKPKPVEIDINDPGAFGDQQPTFNAKRKNNFEEIANYKKMKIDLLQAQLSFFTKQTMLKEGKDWAPVNTSKGFKPSYTRKEYQVNLQDDDEMDLPGPMDEPD